MSRIALFFATSSLYAMDNQPLQKKEPFSQKPYLYAWPEEHSVQFDPEIHKIPWLGLITHTPHVLTLEEAAARSVKNTDAEKEIANALSFQEKFGFNHAVPAFIACCKEQEKSLKK